MFECKSKIAKESGIIVLDLYIAGTVEADIFNY